MIIISYSANDVSFDTANVISTDEHLDVDVVVLDDNGNVELILEHCDCDNGTLDALLAKGIVTLTDELLELVTEQFVDSDLILKLLLKHAIL